MARDVFGCVGRSTVLVVILHRASRKLGSSNNQGLFFLGLQTALVFMSESAEALVPPPVVDAPSALATDAPSPVPGTDATSATTSQQLPEALQRRLQSMGDLYLDVVWADRVRAGRWRVLARVGTHTLDFTVETQNGRTDWPPGQSGGFLARSIPFFSIASAAIDLTVWPETEDAVGRNPVGKTTSPLAASGVSSHSLFVGDSMPCEVLLDEAECAPPPSAGADTAAAAASPPPSKWPLLCVSLTFAPTGEYAQPPSGAPAATADGLVTPAWNGGTGGWQGAGSPPRARCCLGGGVDARIYGRAGVRRDGGRQRLARQGRVASARPRGDACAR